jgi:hypothetical protein
MTAQTQLITEANARWWLEKHGRELAKARTKARGRVPWAYHNGRVEVVPVTLQEVIDAARRVYPELEVSLPAARKWISRRLLDAAKISGRGQGLGTRADYPADAGPQMATAAYLMALRYTQGEIAQARQWYLEGIPEGEPVAQALIGGQALERRERDKLQCLRLYARSLILHRCGMGAIWPFGEFRTAVLEAGRVRYIVSLPGVWRDPRHEGEAELDRADSIVRDIHGED